MGRWQWVALKEKKLALEGYFMWCSLSPGVELVQHFHARSCHKMQRFAHKIC